MLKRSVNVSVGSNDVRPALRHDHLDDSRAGHHAGHFLHHESARVAQGNPDEVGDDARGSGEEAAHEATGDAAVHRNLFGRRGVRFRLGGWAVAIVRADGRLVVWEHGGALWPVLLMG